MSSMGPISANSAIRKNVIRLYIIKTAKWFMLVMPIIVPFYEENGLDLESIYILKAVYSIAIVVFEIPSGYLADILGRKNTLLAGSVLGTLGYGVYALSTGFTGFFTAELILGAGLSMVSGADSALLYDSLAQYKEEKRYSMYEGRVTSIGNFAESVAGLAGGLLAVISLRLPFYIQTAVAFTAIPAALTLWEPSNGVSVGKAKFGHILYIVRTALFTDARLRTNILFSSVIGAATLSMAWFIQPYFSFTGVPLAYYGILWTALNLSVGFVSVYAYKIENYLGEKTTLIIISAMVPAGFLITAWLGSIWGLIIIFLFYLVSGVATPVLKDYINRLTMSEMRATVLSVRNFVIRVIFAIIAPLTGRISDTYDIRTGLAAAGILFTILVIPLLLLYLRRVSGNYDR